MAAQRIVMQTTIDALPEPLSTHFAPMRETLLERVVEPVGLWEREPRYQKRQQWCFLHLDLAAQSNAQSDRMVAASSFPTEPGAAARFMREHDVKRGGRLPWALEDLTQKLSRAFASADQQAIAERTGHLVALCTFAANPFRVTRNDRGAETSNAIFADAQMGDPFFAHQDVAQRFGWELIRRYSNRYRLAIESEEFRYPLEFDARSTIFETMLGSLDHLGVLCKSDRDVQSRMGLKDRATFLERKDEYYELLDDACGDHAVEMLRRASRLSVVLVFDAYQRAGSPKLGVTVPSTPVKTANAPAEKVAAASEPEAKPAAAEEPAANDKIRVASKRSKVFHRSFCNHVKRISKKNLVEYADDVKAKESGKRPCRACHGGG
ncbi:MAG: hypothetical protein GXP29_01160 [Planctomycetes bacterium]|nr:hypothetical protein [Planctomycetota bacterium]